MATSAVACSSRPHDQLVDVRGHFHGARSKRGGDLSGAVRSRRTRGAHRRIVRRRETVVLTTCPSLRMARRADHRGAGLLVAQPGIVGEGTTLRGGFVTWARWQRRGRPLASGRTDGNAVTDMKQAQGGPVQLPPAGAGAPQGLELRHLRYFVALAEAGNFTHAAERMYIAQPTLSQQIRRLEEIIGTPLLQRRREGLRLTRAGTVLLDASRKVLSLVDHGMSETRRHRRNSARPDPAAATDDQLRCGPGQPPRSSADRHGCPGMERRPAPRAPADPVRYRRRRYLADSGPVRRADPGQRVGRGAAWTW